VPQARYEAEHESLVGFLQDNLDDHQRARIGLMSFNQWPWTTAAIVETAVAAHQAGSDISVAFWCDRTPLPDPGWTTSHRVARLLGSHPIEHSAQKLIELAGVPDTAFVRPPLTRHRSRHLPNLPRPLTRAAIRQLSYENSGMGRSILQVHPNFDTPTRDDLVWPKRWIRRAMKSYAWVYDQTSELIRQRDLTTIVVFNGRFTHDRAAAAAAEAHGVKVLYYDYGGIETYFDLMHTTTHNWDALQDRMRTMWERWGPDREEIAHRWFAARENHTEPGIDVFIGLQEAEHLPDLPQTSNMVVFFSSSGDEIAELDLDWSNYFESQEGALLALAKACDELPDATLVVRTHPHMRLKPKDDLARWVEAVEAIGRNVHIGPDDPTDSYALMRTAHRVVTYGSTSGIEAAYRKKPVAVMGPSAYQLLGCVTPITTNEHLREWLAASPNTSPELSLPYGLMMQRRGFNLEWLCESESLLLGKQGVFLREASEKTRKISDIIRRRRLKRWTAR